MKEEILRDIKSAKQKSNENLPACIPVWFRLGNRVDTAAVTTDSTATRITGRRPVKSRLDERREVSSANRDEQPKNDSPSSAMPDKEFKQMVEQVRDALTQSKGGALILKDKPYPKEVALLELKASVSDTAGLLSGWIVTSDHCSWRWISCDASGRVVAVNISAFPGDTPPSCSRSRPFQWCYSDPGRSLAGKLSPSIGKLTTLRILSLAFHSFYGEIPREIWGLKNLEVIDLEGNSLLGTLPLRFPRSLRVLKLASNLITGEIPISLSRCIHLLILDLSRNRLNGSLPRFLISFPKLTQLHLSFNLLEKSIPEEIGSGCLSLEYLDLSGNLLIGSIPSSLGNCTKLQFLLLASNRLDSVIPPDLGRLENLRALDVSKNCLRGYIPEELGNCKELVMIVLTNMFDRMPAQNSSIYHEKDESNYFHGGISWKITALPKLRILWAPKGNLEGDFPSYWGICKSLEMVSLGQNRFTGDIPRNLSKCVNIKFLDLSLNKLTGSLSEELPVPCMDFLDVSGNHLSGSIPRFIHKKCPLLPSPTNDLLTAYSSFFTSRAIAEIDLPYFESSRNYVVYHNFSRNNLSGMLSSLPVVTDRYENHTVYTLQIGENYIAGSLTDGLFSRCRELSGLVFICNGNRISGEIPVDIGVICRALIVLNASSNQITGIIPQSIKQLDRLVVLDLCKNQLKGEIPSAGLSGIKALRHLSIGNNNFSGKIPARLNDLHFLQELDFLSNFHTGEISSGQVKLRKLSFLMLNDSKLSRNLPSDFLSVESHPKFNVSYNNLSSPLPLNSSMISCDRPRDNPLRQACLDNPLSISVSHFQNSSKETHSHIKNNIPAPFSPAKSSADISSFWITAIASAAAIASVILFLLALYIYSKKCVPSSSVQSSEIRDVTTFVDVGIPLTYETVVRATGNFNTSYCIGSGGFGATYKAEISPGVHVAIKRLSVGRFQGVQQFHAEIKTLGMWRHSNLVTLIGYYGSDDEMFLIYNFLPGGNLEKFLQERSRRPVDWKMLHKIALDVARALAYLHGQCVPRILHRDVKPSNILLDNDFNAYLSDFGLARLLGNSETHATTGVAGTFGYVAPEYAMTCRVSDKADVYSYGVVLLELLSDKKALDPSFSPYGDGFNIVTWASMLLHQTRAHEFFTEGLWQVAPRQQLIETFKLALRCTEEQLSQRPSIRQVVRALKDLQP
ncbi:LOW QUALITY PROTEIN: LRR receptor-like serine/threonine-protein kinase RPK2 [Phalaenopsis equestris]|uniref:LOW QUALITY PROTEIN: LRR receptor-like serine/threonine-protein kinase RPK2 n=1 Tax=Phalaenopsis equestris TaxID=78828 RepID=UPI0009E4A7F7|nr:LOW QUALITY PROTEIN: LRR receptor-like serine/threonine-protein kinase RPK2 [Phalaenopsis equestris]